MCVCNELYLSQEASEEGVDVMVAMVTVGIEGGHQFATFLPCGEV